MYSMLETPLIDSSIGTATFSATCWAFAPKKVVVTVTVGGVMFGYCSRGSDAYDSPPISMNTSAIAIAKIGRWMKNWLIIRLGGRALGRHRRRGAHGDAHPGAGLGPLQPLNDHAVSLLHPVEDDLERPERPAVL